MKKPIYNPTKLYDADINNLVESSIPSEELEKAKIVTRQGRRFYADGPSKGKEVGTVRGKGRKQQAEPKKKEEPKKEFRVGETVKHPEYGLAVVDEIENRKWKDGSKQSFYVLKINERGTEKKVFVSTESAKVKLEPFNSKESGYGAGDRMAELRDAGMGKEPEKKQAEPKKADKNVEMGSKALREAGYPELADKLDSGEMSKEDAADWAEDRNFHGVAAMLRADENTDLKVLENAEQAHNDFDLGPRDQSYEGERDGALNAKYEAANYEPLKDMKEGRFGKEWAARRKMDAALYLMENGLEDSDTFKKLKKDFTDSENMDVANKTLKELVNDSDRSTGMWLRLSQDPSSDFEPEMSRQIAKESAQRAVKLLKLGKKFDLDT